MNARSLICRDSVRREAVRCHPQLHGLDYLEVDAARRTLEVYFLGKAPAALRRENVRIAGGRRVRDVQVKALQVIRTPEPAQDDRMVIEVDRWGDASTYTLRVVAVNERGRPTDAPMPGFDPRSHSLEFEFTAGCPSELDCAPRTRGEQTVPAALPAAISPTPPIDYLAKDFAGFRRIMLDRLAATMPDWQDRDIPDLGVTLVELLAYAADHLSYYQDAVATEAYLETARQRISVRRHARLMDYSMHEGVNARAWVTLGVTEDMTFPPAGVAPEDIFFVTGWRGMPPDGAVVAPDDLPPAGYETFEPVRGHPMPVELRAAHNRISFYTWGERQCCLARGATQATLRDPGMGGKRGRAPREHALALAPGDVLVLEEAKGPHTGVEADADPGHRHAVRLVRVERGVDPLTGQLIVEIAWDAYDALPFALCLSAVGAAPRCELIEDVSVARGNVMLVDHGRRVEGEDLPPAPESPRRWRCEDECRAVEIAPEPPRYHPGLEQGPLVFAEPYDPRGPACAALDQDPRRARPWLELRSGVRAADGTFAADASWEPRADLWRSSADDYHVVVEVDDDGRGRLRFGDGALGRRPAPGTALRASYRVGRGPDGNVGAGAIRHVGLRSGRIAGASIRVRNPMPARGGTAPEPVIDVRRLAPHAWRDQLERAVAADDYARIAERHPLVQHAAARLRWTGSGWVVQVALDPRGRAEAPPGLIDEVAELLAPYRRMGHEVQVRPARYVSLDIWLSICVLPGYQEGAVQGALLRALSARALPDGSRGLFHPDRLRLGEPVRVSAVIAAARAVTGVESVVVRRFRRLGERSRGELDEGSLHLGPFEVARLDNDPAVPEGGRLRLDLRGAR